MHSFQLWFFFLADEKERKRKTNKRDIFIAGLPFLYTEVLLHSMIINYGLLGSNNSLLNLIAKYVLPLALQNLPQTHHNYRLPTLAFLRSTTFLFKTAFNSLQELSNTETQLLPIYMCTHRTNKSSLPL